MALVKVASVNDLEDGQSKMVEANGKKIALFKQSGKFHALDNTCVHQGGPLGEGSLEGNTVTCPWHSWTYDITTGVSPDNPAAKVATFKVEVQGDDVLVDV